MGSKQSKAGAKQSKEYFSLVYKSDKNGQFKQSRFDKLRDGIFVKLFNKYSQKPLTGASVMDTLWIALLMPIKYMAQTFLLKL